MRVQSHGSTSAEIFFVAGFGTTEEIAEGEALIGQSAKALEKILRWAKLPVKLQNTYRAVWLKEPPEYRGMEGKKLREAIAKLPLQELTEELYQEIVDVGPNLIVPIDDLALKVVTDRIHEKAKMPRNAKSWMDCYFNSLLTPHPKITERMGGSPKVVPIHGPKYWYVDPVKEHLARLVAEKTISRVAHDPSPIKEDWIVTVAKNLDQVDAYFKRAYAKGPWLQTFDIETWGSLPTCISFCHDGVEGISIPLWNPRLSASEMAGIWHLVSDALGPKVINGRRLIRGNQNIIYDIGVLLRHGFYVDNVQFDPMIATGAYLPELPKNLGFLTAIHTNMPYHKDEGKVYDPTQDKFEALQSYNAKDAITVYRIIASQMRELQELPRTYHFIQTELTPLIPVYTSINSNGIRVDEEKKRKVVEKYETLHMKNLSLLQTLINNNEFNPASTAQVGQLIYEELKFPKRVKPEKTAKGETKYKTDKNTLDELAMKYALNNEKGKLGKKIIAMILTDRKLRGVLQYLNTKTHLESDGEELFSVFRCSFNLAGTNTGRTSASKTTDEYLEFEKFVRGVPRLKKFGLGRSLQTITKHGFTVDEDVFMDLGDKVLADDMRSIFRPRKGYRFVEIDGSQAEARVVALLAEDYELLAAFDQKPKVHAKTAAMIFGGDPKDIGKSSPVVPGIGIPFYDMGKRISHAGNYDMTEYMLAIMTHAEIQQCREWLGKYHSGKPNIRKVFHAQVAQAVQKTRTLETPLGRFRQFYQKVDAQTIKQCYAYIPQSTIGDHTKCTMPRVIRHVGYDFYRFLSEMHDGILAEVKIGCEAEYAIQAKKDYEREIDFRNCTLSRDHSLVIPAEVSLGDDWSDLEEVHL